MALDFLSAPATSTDVERLFSHGGLIVTKRRHNMTPQSVRESTVLQNWMTIEGLVPRKDIIKVLNQKRCRRKQDSDGEDDSDDDELGETPLPSKKKSGKGRQKATQKVVEVLHVEDSSPSESSDSGSDAAQRTGILEDDPSDSDSD